MQQCYLPPRLTRAGERNRKRESSSGSNSSSNSSSSSSSPREERRTRVSGCLAVMAYVQGRSESLYEFLASFKPRSQPHLPQVSTTVGLLTRDGAFRGFLDGADAGQAGLVEALIFNHRGDRATERRRGKSWNSSSVKSGEHEVTPCVDLEPKTRQGFLRARARP